jgi:hypothetical protein
VKKSYCLILVVLAVTLLCSYPARANDIVPTPWSTFFRDSLTTYNGQPIPVGSVIDAYDPDDVRCGTWIVTHKGLWGNMAVYGDDPYSPEDEGATDGQPISFTINHRPATVVLGDNTFTNQAIKLVQLAATGTVAFSAVDLPNDTVIVPGHTIKLGVTVKNDGDGLDFYRLRASSPDPNWTVTPQDSFSYAQSGANATVYFNVTASIWNSGYPPYNTITFTLYSGADTTLELTDSVYIEKFGTNVWEDGPGALPNGFALHQNYPNPFNPTTTIAFTLARRSQVTLEVIDILGRVIDERDLGTLAAETHTVPFDASGLASGVYLYRITTEFGSESRKMMLLK